MRKRKNMRRKNPKTLDLIEEGEAREFTSNDGKGFFACYLLTSLSPRHKGHTYIGFTVNPRRRIRQHNGEITCGAWRTKSKRPWEMVLCIYGFPSNVSALQFEWAWQHPRESLAVREAAAAFRSFSGVANKIKLAYTMLNLPAWQSLNLTVNFFSTKYKHHTALCPSLPEHMKVQVCRMDDITHFTEQDDDCGSDAREEEHDNNQNTPGNTTDKSDKCYPGEKEVYGRAFEPLEEPNTVDMNDQLHESEEIAEKTSDTYVDLCESEDDWAKDCSRNHMGVSDEEVEVIDLLTPPSCRVGSFKKKQKCAEFIDLTKSPNFIQL